MALARRKRGMKRTKKPRQRRKARPRRAKPTPSGGFEYRTLVAILMLLYMLRLIDERTFNRMTGRFNPKRGIKRRRPRKHK